MVQSPHFVSLRIGLVEGPVKLLQKVAEFLDVRFLGGRYREVLPGHARINGQVENSFFILDAY